MVSAGAARRQKSAVLKMRIRHTYRARVDMTRDPSFAVAIPLTHATAGG